MYDDDSLIDDYYIIIIIIIVKQLTAYSDLFNGSALCNHGAELQYTG